MFRFHRIAPRGFYYEGSAFGLIPIWAREDGEGLEIAVKYWGTGWLVDLLALIWGVVTNGDDFPFKLRYYDNPLEDRRKKAPAAPEVHWLGQERRK